MDREAFDEWVRYQIASWADDPKVRLSTPLNELAGRFEDQKRQLVERLLWQFESLDAPVAPVFRALQSHLGLSWGSTIVPNERCALTGTEGTRHLLLRIVAPVVLGTPDVAPIVVRPDLLRWIRAFYCYVHFADVVRLDVFDRPEEATSARMERLFEQFRWCRRSLEALSYPFSTSSIAVVDGSRRV